MSLSRPRNLVLAIRHLRLLRLKALKLNSLATIRTISPRAIRELPLQRIVVVVSEAAIVVVFVSVIKNRKIMPVYFQTIT